MAVLMLVLFLQLRWQVSLLLTPIKKTSALTDHQDFLTWQLSNSPRAAGSCNMCPCDSFSFFLSFFLEKLLGTLWLSGHICTVAKGKDLRPFRLQPKWGRQEVRTPPLAVLRRSTGGDSAYVEKCSENPFKLRYVPLCAQASSEEILFQ